MKCEVCKRKGYELINIGLNIGYEIGDYGEGKIDYKVKPQIIRIVSIYLCQDCKKRLKRGEFLNINVLPKLKEFLKENLAKKLIIDSLQDENS